MRQDWRHLFEARAPRYTSYPSALTFSEAVEPAHFCAKLDGIGLYEPLSLYIHVPFCRQLCWFCGCNMRVENDYSRVARYVDALSHEIELVGSRLGGRGRPVTLHFGGGTPNYLSLDDLERVLKAVEMTIGLTDDATLAIEIDPRTLGAGDITALQNLGFSRFSFGVQDLDPQVQAAVNRRLSFDMLESAVAEARRAGVDDLAFDFLYGLPHQTEDSFSRALTQAIALGPDRFSVFGYAHLPKMLRHQQLISDETLPDALARAALSNCAEKLLTAAGYLRIGFDHYAKPDNALAFARFNRRLKRNFQGFTADCADSMIGFGASAISFIDGLYAQNIKSIDGYRTAVEAGGFAIERGIQRNAHDQIVAKTIDALLCFEECDLTDLLTATPLEEAKRIENALADLESQGVIRRRERHIKVAPDAYALTRNVAMAIDPRARAAAHMSRAV